MSDMFGDLPNSGPIYNDGKGTNIPDTGINNNNNNNNNTIPINNNNNTNNKNPSNPDWPVNPDFPSDPKIIIDPNSGYNIPDNKDKGTGTKDSSESDNYLPFDPYTNLIPSDNINIKPQNYTPLIILGVLALFLITTKNT